MDLRFFLIAGASGGRWRETWGPASAWGRSAGKGWGLVGVLEFRADICGRRAVKAEPERSIGRWKVSPHLEDLAKRKQGCIILTAHMGNYDIAAPSSPRDLTGRSTPCGHRNGNRKPSRSASRKSAARRRESEFPHALQRDGGHLGIELARLLRGKHSRGAGGPGDLRRLTDGSGSRTGT